MCSQGGAPLLHFPQAFIEHFLIPVINIYVAFYSWLTPSTAMSSSNSPIPSSLHVINPLWRGAEVTFRVLVEHGFERKCSDSKVQELSIAIHTSPHAKPIMFADSPWAYICD